MPRPKPRTEERLELDCLSKPAVDSSIEAGDLAGDSLFFFRLSGVLFGSIGGALRAEGFAIPCI
jgi:hypothetical protein